MDVLTDILSTLRLQGTVYFQADFRSPWGMDIKGGSVANFHLVVKGRCWLRGPGQNKISELNEGDMVVFAHGDRHALLHSPEAEAMPANELIGTAKHSTQPEFGGNGEATTLICGHYDLERAGDHPLLAALPALILLHKEEQSDWIASASRLTVLESDSRQDGSNAVVDRMAEVLLIQVIRAYSERLPERAGFLAALAEPTIARALSLLHDEPARSWQLADLALSCGTSSKVILASRLIE